MQQNLALWH